MALLYFVREGYGDDAVAGSVTLPVESVAGHCIGLRARYAAAMPVIGRGPVNPVAEPIGVVVHVTDEDECIDMFANKGYYLLENIRPREARAWAR